MLIGLTVRTVGLFARGVTARLPDYDIGDGNMFFAPKVGESGVGKPGYFLPTSVRRDRIGLCGSGCGIVGCRLVMLSPVL